MGWWPWLLYFFGNWYFWPFLAAMVSAVAWPFIRTFRLWKAKRRFIRSQGAKLQNPQNADARFQLANIYAEGGSWGRAVEYAQAAVQVAQENPLYDGKVPYHFLRLLGDAHYHRRQFKEASSAYERALGVKSDLGHSEARFGLGRALHRRGDMERAFDTYNQSLEDNGSNLEGYFRLAQAAAVLGRGVAVAKVKREFWRVAASLPAFAGRHRLRWRIAMFFFPISRFLR